MEYRFRDLEEDCFGGASSSMSTGGNGGMMQDMHSDFKNDYSRNAYMLIYEKRQKEKIKLIVKDELLQ